MSEGPSLVPVERMFAPRPNPSLVRRARALGLPLRSATAWGCAFHALFRPTPRVGSRVRQELARLGGRPYLGLHFRTGISTRNQNGFQGEPYRSCPTSWYWYAAQHAGRKRRWGWRVCVCGGGVFSGWQGRCFAGFGAT